MFKHLAVLITRAVPIRVMIVIRAHRVLIALIAKADRLRYAVVPDDGLEERQGIPVFKRGVEIGTGSYGFQANTSCSGSLHYE